MNADLWKHCLISWTAKLLAWVHLLVSAIVPEYFLILLVLGTLSHAWFFCRWWGRKKRRPPLCRGGESSCFVSFWSEPPSGCWPCGSGCGFSKSVRMATKKFESNTVRTYFVCHNKPDQKRVDGGVLIIFGFGAGAKWGSSVKFPEKVSFPDYFCLQVLNTDVSVEVRVQMCQYLAFSCSSRQRISSRSIQEKMERLAQAAQVSKAKTSPQSSIFILSLTLSRLCVWRNRKSWDFQMWLRGRCCCSMRWPGRENCLKRRSRQGPPPALEADRCVWRKVHVNLTPASMLP